MNDIVVSFILNESLSNEILHKLIDLSSRYCEHLTMGKLSKLTWSQGFEGNRKTKSLKFTLLNKEKILDNQKDLSGIELLKPAKNPQNLIRDNDFYFNYRAKDRLELNSKIYVQIKQTPITNTAEIKLLVEAFLKLLKKSKIKLVYGFIYLMKSSKYPLLYSAGIESEYLTNEEKMKVKIWGNMMDDCDKFIWDLYWGNLISKNHIVDKIFISQVEEIVGSQNLYYYNDDVVLFYLPFEIDEYSNNEDGTKETINRIRDVFSKRRLFMEQNILI